MLLVQDIHRYMLLMQDIRTCYYCRIFVHVISAGYSYMLYVQDIRTCY